jgi:hypothetical protein
MTLSRETEYAEPSRPSYIPEGVPWAYVTDGLGRKVGAWVESDTEGQYVSIFDVDQPTHPARVRHEVVSVCFIRAGANRNVASQCTALLRGEIGWGHKKDSGATAPKREDHTTRNGVTCSAEQHQAAAGSALSAGPSGHIDSAQWATENAATLATMTGVERLTAWFDWAKSQGLVDVKFFPGSDPTTTLEQRAEAVFRAVTCANYEEVSSEELDAEDGDDRTSDVGPSGQRLPIDRPWSDYPLGTKAFAASGGHWVRQQNGWKWCTGDTFPTPGGDAVGIELPATSGDLAKDEFIHDVDGEVHKMRIVGDRLEIYYSLDAEWSSWTGGELAHMAADYPSPLGWPRALAYFEEHCSQKEPPSPSGETSETHAPSPADGPAKSLPLPNSNRPLGVVDSEHGQIEWGPGCDYPNEASARARADEIQRELEEQWATEEAQPDWPAKVFGREWEQQLNAHCNQTFDLDIEPLFLRLDCDGEVNFGTIDSWSADEAEQMLISAFSALLSLIPAEQVVQAMGEETKDTIRMALLCEEEHEIADLRTIISECASAVGAFAAPSCSLAFMREVPKEVDSQFAKKRAQVDDLARRLHESQDAARDALRREREALARAEKAEEARAEAERRLAAHIDGSDILLALYKEHDRAREAERRAEQAERERDEARADKQAAQGAWQEARLSLGKLLPDDDRPLSLLNIVGDVVALVGSLQAQLEQAQAGLKEADLAALSALSRAGICTPAEGFAKAGWGWLQSAILDLGYRSAKCARCASPAPTRETETPEQIAAQVHSEFLEAVRDTEEVAARLDAAARRAST